jgi:hypothetical protein
MSRTWYQVGIANDPRHGDKYYDDEPTALAKAREMADAYGFNTPVAVWTNQDEPLWVLLLGEKFKRV